jgi:uncharacterized protein HemX
VTVSLSSSQTSSLTSSLAPTSTPSAAPSVSSTSQESTNKGNSAGAKAGIGIGCAAVAVLILGGAVFIWSRRQAKMSRDRNMAYTGFERKWDTTHAGNAELQDTEVAEREHELPVYETPRKPEAHKGPPIELLY